jgi:hypothetical protein
MPSTQAKWLQMREGKCMMIVCNLLHVPNERAFVKKVKRPVIANTDKLNASSLSLQ